MSRFVVNITWDEVPHLSNAEKDELWRSIPVYQRKARSKGIPVLGSGVIYPFEEERVKVDPFAIPREWPRCFGLDTDAGAGWTAIAWLAWDRQDQTVYLTKEYKNDTRALISHIDALSSYGQVTARHKPHWMPGVGDARGLMVTEEDSRQVIDAYREKGVDLDHADKAVEAGIQDVYDLIEARRFKVFSTCQDWFAEFRQYHRKDGKIVKVNDHLMDATRYAIRSGLKRAMVAPRPPDETPRVLVYDQGSYGTGWMGM